MAMGKPILISVDGEARQLVETAGAGRFVPPEDAAALARAIVELQEQPEVRERLGSAGRQFVETHFDRRKLASDYLQLIQKVHQEYQGA